VDTFLPPAKILTIEFFNCFCNKIHNHKNLISKENNNNNKIKYQIPYLT
jgi:hypothetical protein